MTGYEEKAFYELKAWQQKMKKQPNLFDKITKGVQKSTNKLIPEKVHKIITETIKNMTKGVLIGSEFVTGQPVVKKTLEEREKLVAEKASIYKKAAVIEGAGTGAGGILLGLADFPLLISIKIKFLFDTARIYGYDVKDYRERLYILHIFQLAFSSRQAQLSLYKNMADWNNYVNRFPSDLNDFDWRTFQQEYRDYIDLAKLMQLIPGIGAVVGAYANYQLMDKLVETAINAYRMRRFVKIE